MIVLKTNSLILISFLSCSFFSLNPMQSTAQNTKEIIYVGTYSERGSKGIYVFEFDREAVKLTEIQALTDR